MDLQLKDLGVRRELYEKIPAAKQELAKIDGYSTVLGKVGCIQKTLLMLSGPTSGQVISADDFLPILIFLVVKVAMPNWIAHLTMMKDLNFSDQDENLNSFLVTSLEAALEHVRSDRLFEPLCPEALLEEDVNQEVENLERSSLEFLFHNIQIDNLTRVQELLTPSNLLDELSTDSLCHPLCDCETCETELSRQKTNLSVNLSSTNNKGLTALHMASKLGRLQIAEFLLEIGSQVTSKDMHGNTPLHYTALGGHQQLMLLLLNSRASPNCMDNNGNTPLHLAAQNGHETCVKALIYFCEHIGRPINVNMPNSSGDTPLHHAAKWGFEGIVNILLEAGARPNIKNNRKASPMDLAHSVHISKLLSVAPIPTKGGFQKRLSFIKMKIAAASKLPLDFLDMSSGSSPLSSPSRSRENLLEYGTKPRSIHQSKKVGYNFSLNPH
jgi:ankyrin repeat domain-containing protein 27